MNGLKILWVDDEIDLLKPHALFLESKGYDTQMCNNGHKALDLVKENKYDVVFLDENMPGLSGLETLDKMRGFDLDLPVVLITKNDAEEFMEDAIGLKADVLVKPVKPAQILVLLKKLFDNKDLVNKKTTTAYQQEFSRLGMSIQDTLTFHDWVDLYKKIVFWEMELAQIEDSNMLEILEQQKEEANNQFFRQVERNYTQWIKNPSDSDTPTFSHQVMSKWVFPILHEKPVFFILVDNLRYDQWRVLNTMVSSYLKLDQENIYSSILPTATQFARNAVFAGMMPLDIERKYPQWWRSEGDEGGKNMFEAELLGENIKRNFRKEVSTSYYKIKTQEEGRAMLDDFKEMLKTDLNALVFNFVDMLSHARAEMDMIKELTNSEAAYRSLTSSWFEHSVLFELIKKLSSEDVKVIITSDHGTIRVSTPSKVIGERSVNTNLRYKHGKSLSYTEKDVFAIKEPQDALLPRQSLSASYIFAKGDYYFVYPNNYNQFVNLFKGTFQHGGISMEEMMVPLAIYDTRK